MRSRLSMVAKFALATDIAHEPPLIWVFKKKDQIISLVITRYHKHTHKFGIELPKTVNKAYAINKATGTTFWHDVIELEMKIFWVAFDVLMDGVESPSDFQYMRCHMIFDGKMEIFHCPAHSQGIVDKSPRNSHLYQNCVLKDVDIEAADVLNACNTIPCHEKNWTTLGKQCGDDCGRKAIIVPALFGLKQLSGHTWPSVFLVIHHNPRHVMDKINSFLPLKPDSIGPPEMNLGVKLKKKTFVESTVAWGQSPLKYV
ncbi:LOW QUALITY PROTEIN: hypothetical protein ACHAW6_013084 [Cyclotella cf. meneghiniana]